MLQNADLSQNIYKQFIYNKNYDRPFKCNYCSSG